MIPPRGLIFIGLNVVRFLSVIGLLLVFSSNIVTLVHDIQAYNRFLSGGAATDMQNCDYIDGSTIPNQPAGIFWAVLNRLLILGQVIVLVSSEIGWPMAFFNRFFPVLGDDFGLGALGVIQCLIGAAILSHHVDDFTLVSAFFLFAVGCVNILLGLIFRASAKYKRSPTCWRDTTKSVLPTHVDIRNVTSPAPSFVSSTFSQKKGANLTPTDSISSSGYGFGRQGEKQARLQGFLISKPVESLPRYAAKPVASGSTTHDE